MTEQQLQKLIDDVPSGTPVYLEDYEYGLRDVGEAYVSYVDVGNLRKKAIVLTVGSLVNK